MAQHSKVPITEVQEFQNNYFKAFPCISAYHSYVRAELKEIGYLTTLFGRRRKFFGRHNDEATIREAVAYRPQSMTAEEINIGMLRLFRENRVELLCQVHDSLLIQCDEKDVNEIVPWALKTLQVHLPLVRGRDFVVPTEAKVGYNWGDVVFHTKDDAAKGLCRVDQVGTVKENENGLMKWKGSHERKRVETPKLSLQSLLL